jgi:pimeloyl-ACP methyl ester carboxylesterase
MRPDLKLSTGLFVCFLLAASVAAISQTKSSGARSGPDAIESRFGEVDGIKIHYLTAGHGPAVILLHGYTQTSRMWKPLIPKLRDKFTVVAPDLPGIGNSDIPNDGLDMKSAAIRIHALAKSLGISKAGVVGHDIGLMVAYAYAAQFPSEVEKLVVMDAFLPGVPGWELAYDSPNFWHFRFHGPTPEALVQGREKIYFAYFWNDLAADGTRSLSEADRASYVASYSRRANASRMGILRFVARNRKRLCAIGSDSVDHARLVHRG